MAIEVYGESHGWRDNRRLGNRLCHSWHLGNRLYAVTRMVRTMVGVIVGVLVTV